MKILSWNVNGIRSIYKKNFPAWLKYNKADFYCLQELKSSLEKIPKHLTTSSKYYSFFNCASKKGYSGVAIFTAHKPLRVYQKIGLERFDQEGRFLRLDFPKFVICNVYLPQGDRTQKNIPYKLQVYDYLLKYWGNIKGKPIILIGDFNIAHQEIDLARPKNNKKNTMFTPAEREKISNLLKSGFIDTFRILHKNSSNYSWWPFAYEAREKNIGWRLDYCFISTVIKDKLLKSEMQKKIMGSDHCPIKVEIKI